MVLSPWCPANDWTFEPVWGGGAGAPAPVYRALNLRQSPGSSEPTHEEHSGHPAHNQDRGLVLVQVELET